jgi:hypothetical protein
VNPHELEVLVAVHVHRSVSSKYAATTTTTAIGR